MNENLLFYSFITFFCQRSIFLAILLKSCKFNTFNIGKRHKLNHHLADFKNKLVVCMYKSGIKQINISSHCPWRVGGCVK